MLVLHGLVVLCLFAPAFAKELVLIQALWRHGDRTPQETYPADPYQEDFWKLKWGQLTTTGMWQHYQQGLRLKARYVDKLKFLNANYELEDTYVRSTGVPRTLMSAYSNLAGFYSTSKNTFPTKASWPTNWSPVPVHTLEPARDHLLHWESACPRRFQLFNERAEFEGYQKFMSQYKELISEIAQKTTWNVTDPFKLEVFFDTIFVEKLYNLTIPAWFTEAKYKELKGVLDLAIDYIYGNGEFGKTENVELIRLTGGALLNAMIENMQKAVKKESPVKYIAYSAHDTTLNALLRALGAKKTVVPERVPEYASHLVLELWKTDDGSFEVELQYSANSKTDFVAVTDAITGCPKEEACPLDKFVSRSNKYVSKDMEKECKMLPIRGYRSKFT
ncbi:hypothetical protein L596_029834 [Steinernema carpocapsae]|uniref:Acid phosphatase n=1 Tax=Steinernema carpocapsae TaxID=34508 RepID=A0A4U5LQY6_STECR|nr:hypothetical protein L596_029834 [Steinernema carpocapsae]